VTTKLQLININESPKTWRPVGRWEITAPHSSTSVALVIAARLHVITFQSNLKGHKFEAVTKIRIGHILIKTNGYFFSAQRFKELEIHCDDGNMF
jgi:hypothetical protein